MTNVACILETAGWETTGLKRLAPLACSATLRHLAVDDDAEIAVLGCDDARIATLNADFRDRPAATNVLSWPALTLAPPAPGHAPPRPEADVFGSIELGDIALAYETCAREAAAAGLSLDDHIAHLLVHGTLHLLGYDHETDADGDLMERLEVKILSTLGVADPYGDADF